MMTCMGSPSALRAASPWSAMCLCPCATACRLHGEVHADAALLYVAGELPALAHPLGTRQLRLSELLHRGRAAGLLAAGLFPFRRVWALSARCNVNVRRLNDGKGP